LEAEHSSGQENELLDPVCDVACELRELNLCESGENAETQEKAQVKHELICLLHTQSKVHCPAKDICIINSNFIDSGATMDGVSPDFCSANGLWEKVVDHRESTEITLAAKQTMTVSTKTVQLTVYMENFQPYTNDFLVIDVPEGQDLLLGMPWLKTTNPDIDWVTERMQPRVQQEAGELKPTAKRSKKKKKKQVKTPHKPARPAVMVGGQRQPVSPRHKPTAEKNYFKEGFFSVKSGTTKYITIKQFKRILKKPREIESIFVIRPKTEKEGGEGAKVVDIEAYRGQPVYPLLCKHKGVF
jgi:hypothetical protein